MPKSRWSAFFSLLLVFLSGALVGGVAHRLYMVKTVGGVETDRPRRLDPEEARRQRIQELRDALKLDDQQLKQVGQVFDETKVQLDQVFKKRNQEARAIDDERV